ncbi:hypothetical protein F4801DRAFT_30154 [Xylaria longipes]|nr:hypothetical protein F4801DRAFT_30154 [Xylaria longipes]
MSSKKDCISGLSLPHMPYKEQVLSQASSFSPEIFHHDTIGIGAQFTEYVSNVLQGENNKYYIKPSCLDDGDLVVFPAISHDDTLCEAQCFKKYRLPDKLYLARKRRIQRLKKSSNLMDEVNQKNIRIIVSRVPEGNPRNCQERLLMDTEAKNQYTCHIQEFPPLCCSGKSNGNIPGNLKCANLSGRELSFAKATSPRLS